MESREAENATNIAYNLDNYPNLKLFLESLVKDIKIEIKAVGKKFEYPKIIAYKKLYTSNGIFFNYFVRKVLSNQFRTELIDTATETILSSPDTYFTVQMRCRNMPNIIERNYLIFKDSNSKAMDILRSIKIVSLSTILLYHDPIPKTEIETDDENLLEVIKYFKTLGYKEVEIGANVDCEYFEGEADVIFDQKVLYEIKTSQFPSIWGLDKVFKVRNFYKLLLYAFGYYKKTGIVIKCFKIYNTLLSYEYVIKFDHINMVLFEDVIKKDVRYTCLRAKQFENVLN